MFRHPSTVLRPAAALAAAALLVAATGAVRSDWPADTAAPKAQTTPVAAATPAPAAKPAANGTEESIADIERQIADLQKKLAELKAPSPTTAMASVPDGTIPADWMKALPWRCIGPANMGGRITAISVFEADPTTYWVATASGGLVKTNNNGITFEHQFDHESTVSIGDICVAPSNKDVVYVGTGENNPRNSVSYGDGVYKSTDGGKTWTNVGLNKSFQIGKIVVHPKNPDIVYVGALGRLYGPNEKRGLFKTTDGGKTWSKILHLDDKTGVIDMRMSPTNPEVLIVATYERKRDEFDGFLGDRPPVPDQYGPIVTFGAGSALYKTADGGKTFKKLTSGLPTVKMGRIGLDWSRKTPNLVFAIIDTEKAGTGIPPLPVFMGIQGEDAKDGVKLTVITKDGPSEKAGLKVGDIVKTVDSKAVPGYEKLLDEIRTHKVGDKVKFGIERGTEKLDITVTLMARPETTTAGGPGGGRGGGGGGGRGGFGGFLTPGFVGEDEEGGGVTVTRLLGDSAAKAGLKEGDLVKAIDGKAVESFRDTIRELAADKKAGDKVKVSVERGKEKKEKLDLTLTLETPQQRGGGGGPGGGRGGPSADKPYSTQLGGQRENAQEEQGKDGFQTGGVYKSTDAGETWTRINSLNPRPMYFSQIRVDPSNDNTIWVLGISLYYSLDGGKKFDQGRRRGVHDDLHALWIDPRDGRHMIIGGDGGFYNTYDQGLNWDHHNFHALGQFYHVAIDPRQNYKVYGGLQDNGSWGGPVFSPRGGIVNDDWVYVNGGDGFVCRVDPTDPDLVYAESQGGMITRRNLRTGERGGMLRPGGGGRGGFGGFGGFGGGPPSESASVQPAAAAQPTQPTTPGGQNRPAANRTQYRCNWNTPFILSSHNPSIFYCMSQFVHRSYKKGDDQKTISPDLTRSAKGSGTALSESPRNADVIWAGTDDGMLWVTRDGGQKWLEVSENVIKAGLPGPRWVATLEASKYVEGRCYATFDAHRSDDDKPYVFVTEDFGATWKSVTGNLPWGSTRVCREDIQNQNVLYVGNEFGIFVTANRGATWTKANNNLPTVAVHEIAQHPTTGDLVVATHGRSIWVLDAAPLRQITNDVLKAKAHLYAPVTAHRRRVETNRGMFSGAERMFVGKNPDNGATIFYSISKKAEKVELKVLDFAGQLTRKLDAKTEPGMYRVNWDLARLPNAAPRTGTAGGGGRQGGGGGGGGGGFGGFNLAPPAQPGMYRVVLTVDGQEFTQSLRVEGEAGAIGNLIAEEEDDD